MPAARQRLAAALALALCVSCGVPVSLRPSIDYALASVSERPFNGVLMLAEGTRVVYAKAAGYADRDSRTPLALSSRFVVGSLTKQVTASLVLQQVDAGRVELDAPVATYLELGADRATRVKVRHLLNHTSGVVALDAPLKTEPGSTFAYSNLGYELLGQILEKVTARSYSETANALLESCGMSQSQILRLGDTPGLVKGYSEQPDRSLVVASQAERAAHLPPGGLVSTVSDLVRWNQCLHHGRILAPTSYAAMVTPSTSRPYRWGRLGYGFGLQIAEPGGVLEYSHSGYVLGFISTMTYYPATDRTLVVLENISWDADNVERAFAQHDTVRQRVLESLDTPWPETISNVEAPTDKRPAAVNEEAPVSSAQSPDAHHRAAGSIEIPMAPRPPYHMLSALAVRKGPAESVALERGSGSGALTGIAGRMTTEIVGEKRLYTLDHPLPTSPQPRV